MKGFSLFSLLRKKNKKTKLKHIAEVLFLVGMFVLPFQIFTIVSQPDIYLSGQINQFNNAAIYLTDIFVILSAMLFLPFIKKIQTGDKLTFGILIVLGVLIVLNSAYPLHWIIFKITTFALVYLLIKNHITKEETLIKTLLAAAVFQSLVAIGQLIKQESIGITFLGEPSLSSTGIAKIDTGGSQIVRSYGTMSHPNMLAGFLTITIILSVKLKRWLPWVAICLAGLVFTFSRSGIITLMVIALLHALFNAKTALKSAKQYIGIVLVLIVLTLIAGPYLKDHFLSTTELKERADQISPAIEMILDNPVGVGFANFTNNIQSYTENKLAPWEYQPVHNIYLLLTAELGVVGIGFVLFLLFNILLSNTDKKTKYAILALAIIGLADHYMYTLYQGQMLVILLLAMKDSTLQSPDTP